MSSATVGSHRPAAARTCGRAKHSTRGAGSAIASFARTSPEFQIEAHLYESYDDVDWATIEVLYEQFGLPLPAGGPPGFVHERRAR